MAGSTFPRNCNESNSIPAGCGRTVRATKTPGHRAASHRWSPARYLSCPSCLLWSYRQESTSSAPARLLGEALSEVVPVGSNRLPSVHWPASPSQRKTEVKAAGLMCGGEAQHCESAVSSLEDIAGDLNTVGEALLCEYVAYVSLNGSDANSKFDGDLLVAKTASDR